MAVEIIGMTPFRKKIQDKLTIDYLVSCIKCENNNSIWDWNINYIVYLRLEFTRLKKEGTELEKGDVFDINNNPIIEKFFKSKDFKRIEIDIEGISKRKLNSINLDEVINTANKKYFSGNEAKPKAPLLMGICFKNVKFNNSILKNLDLRYTIIDGASFDGCNLYNSSFTWSSLEKSIFTGADLRRVGFREAKLNCADFRYAVVDSGTTFGIIDNSQVSDYNSECGKVLARKKVSKKTYTQMRRYIKEHYYQTKLSSVTLCQASVDPVIRSWLEYYMRRDYWGKWCTSHKVTGSFITLFWLISDYGFSTIRIIGCFIGLNVIFGFIYYILQNHLHVEVLFLANECSLIEVLLQSIILQFSTVGFLTTGSLGVLVSTIVCIQLCLGYLILGALVSRFAIIFQSVGSKW